MSTVADKQNGAVLRAAMITAFITTFMGSSLNMSIPAIETEFQVSGALVGWVVTSYTIAVAALSVPFGRISRYNRTKKDISHRSGVFRSCITGLHVFTGYPGDDDTPCTPGGCRRHDLCYQQRDTDKRLSCQPERKSPGAFYGSDLCGAVSRAAVAGGFLNHYVGWRSIFAAAFVVSAAAFLASRRHIPNDRQPEDSISFDISGNILYICAIGHEPVWAQQSF